jgi:hypothetical protein
MPSRPPHNVHRLRLKRTFAGFPDELLNQPGALVDGFHGPAGRQLPHDPFLD